MQIIILRATVAELNIFLVTDAFLYRSNKRRQEDRGFLSRFKWILLHLIWTGEVKLAIGGVHVCACV